MARVIGRVGYYHWTWLPVCVDTVLEMQCLLVQHQFSEVLCVWFFHLFFWEGCKVTGIAGRPFSFWMCYLFPTGLLQCRM